MNLSQLGNYIQLDDDSYSVGVMFSDDERNELLATVRYENGEYTLDSIQSYSTGDFYYRLSGDTIPYSKGDVSVSRSVQTAPTPEPAQSGMDYVLNKNTLKFHYPSCSSADDIKPKNRWDYHGTREEIIAMGYVPCKRCNP